MAVFHASLTLISRSQGHSAVAAAAYRAGLRLSDQRTGLVHDFTKKKGVEATSMRVPLAAAWAHDVPLLWNRAEAAETRVNARVGRELVVALPHELSPEGRATLATRIADDLVERYRVGVLVAIHAPNGKGDDRNHHAHLLMTTRVLTPDGFGAKVRVLDDQKSGPIEVAAIRALVADRTNAALADAGVAARIDHRTLRVQAREAADRGDLDAVATLVREPTRHVGRSATAAVRRGETSPMVDWNLLVRRDNDIVAAEGRSRIAAMRAPAEASTPSAQRAPKAPLRTRVSAGSPAAVTRRIRVGNIALASRASGRDAALLNSQSAAAQGNARIAREDTERYLAMLAEVNREAVESWRRYITALALSDADAYRLLECLRERPDTASVLRRAADAWDALDEAERLQGRRRTAHGKAMVGTATAQAAVEAHDGTKPALWRPLTRREWAEKRRAQHAALAGAQGQERQARRAVRDAGVGAARNACERAEEERRRVLPLQSEQEHRPSASRRPGEGIAWGQGMEGDAGASRANAVARRGQPRM